MKRCKLIISGKVQHVYFRAFLKEQANIFGVKGWCKNLSTGEVETVAEGDDNKINEFIIEAEKGSPASFVERVEKTFDEYKNEFSIFEIIE